MKSKSILQILSNPHASTTLSTSYKLFAVSNFYSASNIPFAKVYCKLIKIDVNYNK